jgi:hypothetical protein
MKLNKLFTLVLAISLVVSNISVAKAETQDLGNSPNPVETKKDLWHWVGVGVGLVILLDEPETVETKSIEPEEVELEIVYIPQECIDSDYELSHCPTSEASALAQGYTLPSQPQEEEEKECSVYHNNIPMTCTQYEDMVEAAIF